MTEEECRRLIATAEADVDPPDGLPGGQDRAMAYRLALGMRAREMAGLIPEDFDLGPDPVVRIRAGVAKTGRGRTCAIPGDLAASLAPWLAEKPRGVPILTLPLGSAGKMIAVDLEGAGIADVVPSLHLLRLTFVMRLLG